MKKILFLLLFFGWVLVSCDDENVSPYQPSKEVELTDPVDIWLYENLQQPYNCVVRWKWDDSYVDVNYYVTPPRKDVMVGVGEMLLDFWLEPFIEAGGEEFILEHFPPEIVCVGSPLYNADGTVTAGYADAGVRITLTELDNFNLSNSAWLLFQLQTIHHEFSHIVHQRHGLPEGWEQISEEDYTGNSWVNLEEEEAIAKGMVSPYATSSKHEDFADFVGLFLTTPEKDFTEKYLTLKDETIADYDGLNPGRLRLQQKYDLMLTYYKSNFSIDIVRLRDNIQQRISSIN
ncbi:MAG: substrate import-associated zinc metallohydrolase lipoprotein [Odoribacter splanchnicus]